jgi:uncharacterized protein (DUF983 family)
VPAALYGETVGMSEQDGTPSVLRAGLTCRCPRCGKGALFASPFTLSLASRCSRCGLPYEFAESGDGPAVFVIMILGFIVLGAALIVEFRFAPPAWVHVVLWLPVTAALAFGLLRPIKALLIAQQYRTKAEEGRISRS